MKRKFRILSILGISAIIPLLMGATGGNCTPPPGYIPDQGEIPYGSAPYIPVINCYPPDVDPCAMPVVDLYSCSVTLLLGENENGQPQQPYTLEYENHRIVAAWGAFPLEVNYCVTRWVEENVQNLLSYFPSPIQCDKVSAFPTADAASDPAGATLQCANFDPNQGE